MSVGPMGMAGSSAGSPLAQSQGSEINRSQQESSDQARQIQTTEKAMNAEGIGQTEQDGETSDRDADGRRLWEEMKATAEEETSDPEDAHAERPTGSKDATKQRGKHLDLSG